MLKSPLPQDIFVENKFSISINKGKTILSSLKILDSCPNCGNTKPVFQHFQNGMLVCFICRKATFNDKNNISAF
jgi:uncharacterized Zn finger protein (UPF0148 family)